MAKFIVKLTDKWGNYLRCPYCNNDDTKVIDSRLSDDNSIKRRRLCEKCNKRFNTYERAETTELLVIKKDNNRQFYDREKIIKGIDQSLVKRPISVMQREQLISDIEKEIFSLDLKEIQSSKIGEIVLNKLKEVDKVAYIRFASVYREFREVKNFGEELKNIEQ